MIGEYRFSSVSSFAESFCQRYRVAPERYAGAMFWRCLHRRALVFVPLLRQAVPDYFAADYDLIRSVGRLKKPGELPGEIADFRSHPSNRDFLRRTLKLRVSARRVARLVNKVMSRESAR